MSIEKHLSIQHFFHSHVVSSLQAHRLEVPEATEFYLVNLLSENAKTSNVSPVMQRPWFELFVEALQAPASVRVTRMKELGDGVLYLLGFFSEHLERLGIAQNYARDMGMRAYDQAGGMAEVLPRSPDAALASVYRDLSHRFDAFVDVLDLVRDQTEQHSPQQVIRLYERWHEKQSPRVAVRLARRGVKVNPSSKSTLH